MKKLIYLTISVLSLLVLGMNVQASNYFTNLYGVEMTQEEYNNLLELGFTEGEIDHMDEDSFLANSSIEGTLEAEEIKYYKTVTTTRNGITSSNSEQVSELEYNLGIGTIIPAQNSVMAEAYTETTYKYLRTTITQLNNAEYRYKVSLNWKNMPSKRSNDIIGIGYQQAFVQLNSLMYARQDYTTSSGSTGYSTSYHPKTSSTGGSATFTLPSGSLSYLSSYLYYDVRKANGVGTVTSMYAGGDYSHATSTVSDTSAQNYSVNYGTGIVLGASIINSYDEIQVAKAHWTGTW